MLIRKRRSLCLLLVVYFAFLLNGSVFLLLRGVIAILVPLSISSSFLPSLPPSLFAEMTHHLTVCFFTGFEMIRFAGQGVRQQAQAKTAT